MNRDVDTSRDIEAVAVVRCWQTIRLAVRRISSKIVQDEVVDFEVLDVGDVEAVRGPVLNVKIADHICAEQILHNEEVIWSRK